LHDGDFRLRGVGTARGYASEEETEQRCCACSRAEVKSAERGDGASLKYRHREALNRESLTKEIKV
jgi:hypothetical protein